MKKPYLVEPKEENRFSILQDQKSDLYEWRDWFLSRGIPAEIHMKDSRYALYREGLIEIDIHKDSPK